MLEQGPDIWCWFDTPQLSYHCVHPIHANMFSIQMLLHFGQIVRRVCTLVLFTHFCKACIMIRPHFLYSLQLVLFSLVCYGKSNRLSIYRDTNKKRLTVLWFITTIVPSPHSDICHFAVTSSVFLYSHPDIVNFFCPHPSTHDSFVVSSDPTTHLARHNPSHTTFYYYTLHCVNYLSVFPSFTTVLHYSIIHYYYID